MREPDLADSVNIMTLRLSQARTGRAVHKAAAVRGINPSTIAQATHLDEQEIRDRLEGVTSFTISELVQVGGLLRVPPAALLEGTG